MEGDRIAQWKADCPRSAQVYNGLLRHGGHRNPDLDDACEKIKEAEGEAEAIRLVQKAMADSIALINEAHPGEGYLAIKSLEAFEKVADGKATKIIIPSEIQGLAGLAASAKEIFTTDTPTV